MVALEKVEKGKEVEEVMETGMGEKEMSSKVKQPIPSLKSWAVLSVLLSYYGWFDQVVDLLQHLSHNSRIYIRSKHSPTLSSIIPNGPDAFGSLRKLPLVSAQPYENLYEKEVFEWPKHLG